MLLLLHESSSSIFRQPWHLTAFPWTKAVWGRRAWLPRTAPRRRPWMGTGTIRAACCWLWTFRRRAWMALERASWGLSSQPYLLVLLLTGRSALPGLSHDGSRAHSIDMRAAPAPLRGTIRRASHTSKRSPQASCLTAADRGWRSRSAAFHELTHWTGGAGRLCRDTIRDDHVGKELRSQEDLVAEMGPIIGQEGDSLRDLNHQATLFRGRSQRSADRPQPGQ
jgi:hypothetical protein